MKSKPATDYRQRLVEALAVTIVRRGYGSVTVRAVADEARVSVRGFYAEFDGLETCFLALYSQQHEALMELVKSKLDLEQPWKSAIREGFDNYFRTLAAFPALTHAAHIQLATLSDAARETRQAKIGEFAGLLADLLEQGRRANPDIPSRGLSPTMARAVMGAVIELVLDHAVRENCHDLDELVDTATDLVWSIVTTPED